MIDISFLNHAYRTRPLTPADVESVLALCRQNPLFYQYTEARPLKEEILNDMRITPPGVKAADKSYFGFFEREELVAVMDLIDGYPDAETAYIGFFLMNPNYQGKGIGSSIVCETAEYLKAIGKTAIRLAIDQGNPQSTHFWKKNGFEIVCTANVNGRTKLVAEKTLQTNGKTVIREKNES